MNISEAIRTAAKRVHLIAMARGQYQVNTWSEKHRAWWQGNITNRQVALKCQHEMRVRITLELLGIEEAYELAASCTYNAYPKNWRQCVRDEIKADKLAASNAA